MQIAWTGQAIISTGVQSLNSVSSVFPLGEDQQSGAAARISVLSAYLQRLALGYGTAYNPDVVYVGTSKVGYSFTIGHALRDVLIPGQVPAEHL